MRAPYKRMKRRCCALTAMASMLLGLPGAALAYMGAFPGPGILLIPVFLTLPVAIGLMAVAFYKRRKDGGHLIATLLTVPVVLYAILMAVGYYALLDDYFGIEALIMSLILFLTLTVLFFYYLDAGTVRRRVIAALVLVFVGSNLATDGLFDFRRVTTVDNNPLPEINDTIRVPSNNDVILGDGRFVILDERTVLTFLGNEMTPVYVKSIGRERIRISFAVPNRQKKRKQPLFHIPLINWKINLNKAYLVGTGRVRPDNWTAQADAITRPLRYGAPCQDEFVRELLARGADPNARHNDASVLHMAAEKRCGEVAALLVEAGADIEARDRYGRTPLNVAAQYTEALPVIRVLIEAGADPLAIDNMKKTPLSIVQHMYREGSYPSRLPDAPEIVDLLESAATR